MHNLNRGKNDRPLPITAFHPFRDEVNGATARPRTTPSQLRDMSGLFKVVHVRADQ
jgi:hypothetical protein